MYVVLFVFMPTFAWSVTCRASCPGSLYYLAFFHLSYVLDRATGLVIKQLFPEALNMHVCLVESVVDDCCTKDYSPFSPQRSDASTPNSLYMESREFSGTLFHRSLAVIFQSLLHVKQVQL